MAVCAAHLGATLAADAAQGGASTGDGAEMRAVRGGDRARVEHRHGDDGLEGATPCTLQTHGVAAAEERRTQHPRALQRGRVDEHDAVREGSSSAESTTRSAPAETRTRAAISPLAASVITAFPTTGVVEESDPIHGEKVGNARGGVAGGTARTRA